MKTWQVLGTAPAAAGLSAPLQVLLVMLKSGPEVAERLTFWLTTKVRGIVALWLPTGVEGKMILLLSLRAMLLPGVGDREVAEAIDGDAAGGVRAER